MIAFGGSEIDDDQVAQMLDLIDRRVLFAILEACVEGDAARALSACAEAGASGVDAKRLGENLLQLLRDMVVLSLAPEAGELVEGTEEDIAELAKLAQHSDTARLRRMFRALVKEQEDLAWAPQPFAVLEMCVVRLATTPSGDDVARLLTRLEALERALSREGGGGGGGSGGERARGAKPENPRRAQPSPRASEDPQAAPPPSKAPTKGAEAGASLSVVFDRLRAFAREEHPGIYAELEGAHLVERGEDELKIETPAAFSARRLGERGEALEALASRFFDRPTRVRIDFKNESVSSSGDQPDPDALRQRRKTALEHPSIGLALEILEGEILEIRPHGSAR